MIYGAPNHPLRPLTDEIKALAALGFDYLELCLDPPNGLPEAIRPRLDEIRSTLGGEGLALPVVHLPTFVWLADVYPSIRAASVNEVLKALGLAAELGVKKAVLHPGYLTGLMTFTPEVGKGYAAESLGQILERSAGLGITICLENLFPRAGHMYKPKEFSDVLDQNPGLMMTLDLGHANIRASKSQITDFVTTAHGRIGHVHVGDNSGREDEHLPVGAGRADIAQGLAAIKASGYDDTITLEVFSPDRDYLAVSLKKVRVIWENAQAVSELVLGWSFGSTIFEVEVAGTDEIRFWIMTWGSKAEVLGPDSLREEIRAEAEMMAERYKGPVVAEAGQSYGRTNERP